MPEVTSESRPLKDTALASESKESRRNSSNGHIPTVTETAGYLLQHGIMPIPLKSRTKQPYRTKWQEERYGPEDVYTKFHDGEGVGARWGYLEDEHGRILTDNHVDGDLDTIEAVRIAPRYFPPTGMIWGRASKPRSHRIYHVPTVDVDLLLTWSDPIRKTDPEDKGRLLEIRRSGHTVAPGSRHDKTGELIEWEPDGHGPPGETTLEALGHAGIMTSAAAMCAEHWRDGDRHDTALPLAGFLWHGNMDEDPAKEFMESVCIGAQDDDVADRLRAVTDTYANARAGRPVTGGPTLEQCLPARAVSYLRKWLGLSAKKGVGILGPDGLPLAGDGDGDRFAAMWVEDVRYCMEDDAWYIWDGRRFALDRVGEIFERAKKVVGEFRRLVGEKENECGRNGVAVYAVCADYSKKLGSDASIAAMLRSARTKDELRVLPEELDADGLQLNCQNVTLQFNFQDGSVLPHLHDTSDLMTKITRANYNPDAVDPLVEQYLSRFFPEEDRRRALRQSWGVSLLGIPKRHGLMLVGPHDSGKTTTFDVYRVMMGDYAATLPYEALVANPHRGGDVPRADLYRVRNARVVCVYEVPADVHLDAALMKTLLGGGDATGVRTLYDKRGGKDILFHFTLMMSGNKPYGPPPNEQAAYDRLLFLACDHQLPASERDTGEEMALTTVQSVFDAVLALAVQGFREVYAPGPGHGEVVEPESSRLAKKHVRENLDTFTDLINRLIVITGDPNDVVVRAKLWDRAMDVLTDDGRERVQRPRAVRKAFEDAVEWRVGRSFTHSVKWWKGKHEYWPGVKWSGEAIETWGTLLHPAEEVSL